MSVGLRTAGLRAGYGRLEVLHGVDVVIPGGTLTALVGPNGAGKTTLLRAIAGNVPWSTGDIRWDGLDITSWPVHRRARAGLELLPERGGVFPDLTVRDHLALFTQGPATVAVTVFPVLAERLDQRAGTLSGGEQRMLALAGPLLRRPRLLLLDEPMLGLAAPVRDALFRVLERMVQAGTTVVLVEQDVAAVLGQAAFVYVLARGDIVFAGEPAELAGRPLPGYPLAQGV